MNTNSGRKLKAILCFFIGGLTGGIILFLITRIVHPTTLWYFHYEYWVRPTYTNFLAANFLAFLFFYLSRLYTLNKGWVISLRAIPFIYQLTMIFGMLAVNSIAFYLLTDMRFYPASLLLYWICLSSSLSIILWIYSGQWSTIIAFLLFICCFLLPNISSFLHIENPVEYDYPIMLAILMGLCGYWLSLTPVHSEELN
jgi:hypothetical protein